jgi:hypothetical protein
MTKVTFAFIAKFNFNLFSCLPVNETGGSYFRCRILYTAANCCSIHNIWSGLLNRTDSEHCQFVPNTDGRHLDSTTNSLKYLPSVQYLQIRCKAVINTTANFTAVNSRLEAYSTFILQFLSPQAYFLHLFI